MKNKFRTIILAIIAVFAISVYACAEESTDNEMTTVCIDESKFGDVNGDGKRTAADARIILRVAAKLESLTETVFIYGDYDRNEIITAADARTSIRVAAGLENMECILTSHILKSAIIKPTCTVDGYKTNRCTRCAYEDEIKTDITLATGHNYKTSKTVKVSCTTDGYTEKKCSKCNDTILTDTVAKTGHKYEYISKNWVTDIPDFVGYKSEKKCKYCDKAIVTYDVRNADIQIEAKPIHSNQAKIIQEELSRYNYFSVYSYPLEGYDITGEKVVLYGQFDGIDIEGYFYNLDGTLYGTCDRCGKFGGLGDNMCNILFCGITFS